MKQNPPKLVITCYISAPIGGLDHKVICYVIDFNPDGWITVMGRTIAGKWRRVRGNVTYFRAFKPRWLTFSGSKQGAYFCGAAVHASMDDAKATVEQMREIRFRKRLEIAAMELAGGVL